MVDIIQNFFNTKITVLQQFAQNFISGEINIDNYAKELLAQFRQLVLDIVRGTIEDVEKEINNSVKKQHFYKIEHSGQKKTYITCTGEVTYSRAYYRNIKTGKCVYLTDEYLGIDVHQRISPEAMAAILEEAVDTSYSRAGAKIIDMVSRQTAKNIIHNAVIPEIPASANIEKKKVKNLYVIADEDHVAKQFDSNKGDLKPKGKGNYNTAIVKLACVYENIVPVSKNRNKLVGKKYFAGLYRDKKNFDFWENIADYIENNYDTDFLDNVFLLADGGRWIKAGAEILPKCKNVIDGYHLKKYLNMCCYQLKYSSDDAMRELYNAIYNKDKDELNRILDRIQELAGETCFRQIEDCRKYITDNWQGILNKVEFDSLLHGCSAEGQVSHVLSARMSSRPMGWSLKGADQMAKLRAYKANGGEMLDIINNQRAAAAEKKVKYITAAEREYLSQQLLLKEQDKCKNCGLKYEAKNIPFADMFLKSIKSA